MKPDPDHETKAKLSSVSVSIDLKKKVWPNLNFLAAFQVHGGDFPHLLVYGPPGSGKKTRVMSILRELYGPGVEKLRIEHCNFTTPSNKKLEIVSIASNYHIEVNPR